MTRQIEQNPLLQKLRADGHLVEFRMDHDGSRLRATVPNVFLPAKGTPLWLMIRRDKCFVFPVKTPGRATPGAGIGAD